MAAKIMRNKYHNHKVVIAGIKFDSQLEGDRYIYLRSLERRGKITHLNRQVVFIVVPASTETIMRFGKKGQPIKPKVVVVEKHVEYRADFTYLLPDGRLVVEDTKGVKTRDYIIKRKLMRIQGHPIFEITHPTQPIPE